MSNEDELYVEQIEIGPMQNFTYLVGSKSTREVALVDPAWEIDSLLELVASRDLTPTAILITHYHPDHCGGGMGGRKIPGVADILERQGMKVYINKHEAEGLKKVTGISDTDMTQVDSGDTLKIGDVEIEFLHTPGHTPGSQCFRIKDGLVSGDTLFVQGCGRVDLPGSNSADMFNSLAKLRDLPDETLLLPGHNYTEGMPNATMAYTRKHNAYLSVKDLETWRSFMGD